MLPFKTVSVQIHNIFVSSIAQKFWYVQMAFDHVFSKTCQNVLLNSVLEHLQKKIKKATIAHFLKFLNEKIIKKLNENLDSAGVEAVNLAQCA